MKRKPRGWRYDPYRHSLAARGVKTTLPYPNKFKGDNINEVEHIISTEFARHDPYGNKWARERGETIKGVAAVKFQLVKTNHWDDDYKTLHRLLAEAFNSPLLTTGYVIDWIHEKIDNGTLNRDIERLVDHTHPHLANFNKTIVLHDFGGMLEGVYNMPKGWKYEYFIINKGDEDDFEKLPKIRSKTVRVVYYEALPETIEGLPKDYDYAVYFDNS